MAFLNLAAVRECTQSEGPGKRFAIWCQGCAARCTGCCNPHMQDFRKNHIVETADLIALIEKSVRLYDIEGVTLLGGEPFLQAAGFAEIAEWCKKNDLSVLAFTGFLLQELLAMNDFNINRILKNCDLLVDGPFLQDQLDSTRDWVGSRNQIVHFLSDRYQKGIEYEKNNHSIEILVSDNKLLGNGWPFF